jgi:hypothetical protein
MPKKKEWKMPEWMEKYREYLNMLSGGNTIEEIVNMPPEEVTIDKNLPLTLVCISVDGAINMLMQLKENNLLKEEASKKESLTMKDLDENFKKD